MEARPLAVVRISLHWVPLTMMLSLAATAAGHAAELLPGPIPAQLIRVIDGDTVEVNATIWPGQAVRALVRLRDLDTPEHRAPCAQARHTAKRAQQRLDGLLRSGSLALVHVSTGKYAGRVIASLRVDGLNPAPVLLAEGLARPYQGGARSSWCDHDAAYERGNGARAAADPSMDNTVTAEADHRGTRRNP